MRIGIAVALLCAGLARTSAGQFEAPSDYYLSATGTGAVLRGQLRAIIGRNYWSPGSTSHLVRSYDSARQSLAILHRDPLNASQLILIYDGRSVPSVWDAGLTWNREHTWPDSRGLGGSGPDYTDLHQLRPCTPSVNGARGNEPFGANNSSYWDPQPSTNPSFFPGTYTAGTNDRGEMARAMMYMDVRYDGADASTTDLVLVNGFPSGSQMGDLAQLLQWHYEDPVNDTERMRNHLVFSNSANPLYFQGNRNPFVDRPEFVWALWGPSANDSAIFVGGAAGPGGTSSQAVTFRVIEGATAAAQFVTVMKTGATPTTFDVTATGAFLVAGDGQGQAFAGGVRSTVIGVEPMSTAIAGISMGSIVIDNTDLTSAGAGQGFADGNDTISLVSEVLRSSNASLDGSIDLNSDVVMSSVEADSGTLAVVIDVHNFGFGATTARMEIDGVSGAGGAFGVSGFSVGLIGAMPGSVTLTFDTAGAAPGVYSRVFMVSTSDEDIPGAEGEVVAIGWDVEVLPPPPNECDGDANGDLMVDFADLTSVLANWGGGAGAGDANHDGMVTFLDITTVLGRWGATCAP